MRSVTVLPAAILLALTCANPAFAAQRSAADEALLQKAIRACNGPQYPSGARPSVNYGRGTFTCIEPGSTRR